MAGLLTTQISAFAPNFQTPYTEQANLTVEREFGRKIVGDGQLSLCAWRAPAALARRQPAHADHHRISGVQRYRLGLPGHVRRRILRHLADHAFGDLPLSSLHQSACSGPIRSWAPSILSRAQSSSVYNGMTVSLKRQMNHGMYFQVGYTLAKAMDDGPDALVVGRPGNVQNSYATARSGDLASTISETASWRHGWLSPEVSIRPGDR